MIIAAAMLTSCASTRRATSSRDTRDSTRIISQQVDSIYHQLMQRDSIYYRDSIYIKEKGDTVTYYVERLRYAYKIKTDMRNNPRNNILSTSDRLSSQRA